MSVEFQYDVFLSYNKADKPRVRRRIFNPQRYVGVKEKFMDASRLQEKYDLSISRDLRPAIARTVAWYSANYESLKDRCKFPPVFGTSGRE